MSDLGSPQEAQSREEQRDENESVWVVVPTFNEAENVIPLATRVLDSVSEANLLIVDDNSPDGTGDIADRLAVDEPRISVLHRPSKTGIGPAYVDGMNVALGNGATYIAQMDCDLSHDPKALPALLDAARSGSDLVLGSRYVAGGSCEQWSVVRRFISRLGNFLARASLGTGYRDLTGGFKLWHRSILEQIDLDQIRSSGYGFQIETTWQAERLHAQITEVPITFRERMNGRSKMSIAIIGEAIGTLRRLRKEANAGHSHTRPPRRHVGTIR